MAKFIVPKGIGKCWLRTGGTGLWTVTNGQRGKNGIFIPCKSKAEAESIRDQLNSGDHNGTINVPKNVYHAR
jgi:hypothetical protein